MYTVTDLIVADGTLVALARVRGGTHSVELFLFAGYAEN
jgi:hypothetical protein